MYKILNSRLSRGSYHRIRVVTPCGYLLEEFYRIELSDVFPV